jgi:hypothetical protein
MLFLGVWLAAVGDDGGGWGPGKGVTGVEGWCGDAGPLGDGDEG